MLHRQHAVVEDGVRNGKAMGLRNLPSKTWQVNCGWILAASIAADLAAWTRLIGLYDQEGPHAAVPQTLRYRPLHLPARLTTHARQRTLKISPGGPEGSLPDLLRTAPRSARTSLTSTTTPTARKENHPGAVGAGAARRHRAARPACRK